MYRPSGQADMLVFYQNHQTRIKLEKFLPTFEEIWLQIHFECCHSGPRWSHNMDVLPGCETIFLWFLNFHGRMRDGQSESRVSHSYGGGSGSNSLALFSSTEH
jgi:hypothetical protein